VLGGACRCWYGSLCISVSCGSICLNDNRRMGGEINEYGGKQWLSGNQEMQAEVRCRGSL